MIAMAPSGFETRDKDKLAHLRQDSEARVADMKSWLAALLVPISTLLSHDSYHPDHVPSTELVAHFRNLWVLCVVFGLSGQVGKQQLHEHEVNALGIIAEKTPPLVLEGANDFVASELEYSSILRKDFAYSVSAICPLDGFVLTPVRSNTSSGALCRRSCRTRNIRTRSGL
jgi:phosphatidylinositol 4-kinase